MVPSGQSVSCTQSPHWWVVVSHKSGAMQSLESLQPATHVWVLWSQYSALGQTSCLGKHSTQSPVALSHTGQLGCKQSELLVHAGAPPPLPAVGPPPVPVPVAPIPPV